MCLVLSIVLATRSLSIAMILPSERITSPSGTWGEDWSFFRGGHAGRVKPVILVGIDAAKPIADCQSLNCDRRGKEYKIDFNSNGSSADSDFARHLRFVTDELIPYVEQRYGGRRDRVDRGIGGWSNGGHWALAAGGLRADLFGKVLALSSSGQGGAARRLARNCDRQSCLLAPGSSNPIISRTRWTRPRELDGRMPAFGPLALSQGMRNAPGK